MAICALCGHEMDSIHHQMEQFVIDTIQRENPEWEAKDGSCTKCIEYYKKLDDPAEADALQKDPNA